jgi:lipopolysaccharide transport protein LptA
MASLLGASQLSYAAENTQTALLKEPVEYSNDGKTTMVISEGVRLVTLNDNVKVKQGSMEILGDTAVIEIEEATRELIKVTVHGTPVRYAQTVGNAGGSVKGNSNIIVLFTQDNTGETVVELTGEARIETPDTTMNCAAIVYLPNLALVPDSTGPCVGSFNQEQD